MPLDAETENKMQPGFDHEERCLAIAFAGGWVYNTDVYAVPAGEKVFAAACTETGGYFGKPEKTKRSSGQLF